MDSIDSQQFLTNVATNIVEDSAKNAWNKIKKFFKDLDTKDFLFSMFHVQKRAEEDLSVLRILLRPFYAAFPVLTHAYRSLSITFSIDLTGVLSILFRRFWNVVTDWPLYSWTPFLRLSAWKISFRLSTFQKIIFGNW